MSFINGIGCDQYERPDYRLLGFEGVAEKDEFPTSLMEERLAISGKLFLIVGVIEINKPKVNIYKFASNEDSDED